MATRVARSPVKGGMGVIIKHDDEIPAGKRSNAGIGIAAVISDDFIETVQSQKNFVFLFDRSGSMDTNDKWPEVIQSINTIKNTPGTDNFTCIFFNTDMIVVKMSDVIIPVIIDGTLDKKSITTINGREIKANGGTDIVRALMEALNIIVKKPDYRAMDNRVILFTDGMPEGSVKVTGSLTALLGKGFSDAIEESIASLVTDVNAINDTGRIFDNEQLRKFPKVYRTFFLPLHVFGIGITDPLYKNVLNDCVNNSTSNNRTIQENDAVDLLKLPAPGTPFYNNSSFLATRIVNERATMMPVLKTTARFFGIAALVDSISDISDDKGMPVDMKVAIQGDDILLEKEYTNAKLRDPPETLYNIVFKELAPCVLDMKLLIDINGKSFNVIFKIEVKDVVTTINLIVKKKRAIVMKKLIDLLKTVMNLIESFPAGCTTLTGMMETMKKISGQVGEIASELNPGGGAFP
jgi:hypothetical protein